MGALLFPGSSDNPIEPMLELGHGLTAGKLETPLRLVRL